MNKDQLLALVPEESNALEAVWAGGFNFCRREMIRRIEALPAQPDYAEALKVAREALQNIADSGRIVRTAHSDAARAALAHIDALIGGNDHEN